MQSLAFLTTIIAALPVADAHWTWVRIAHNGVWQEPTRFIRNLTSPFHDEPLNPPGYHGVFPRYTIWPTYAWDLPNSVRCGRGNFEHAAETEVLKVKAGDTIEFAHSRYEPEELVPEMWSGCEGGYGTCALSPYTMDFNHPGPLILHLSKVPTGTPVTAYDGSGNWTKVYTLGVKIIEGQSAPHWIHYNWQGLPPRAPFKIPSRTPAGQYLLRIDTVWGSIANTTGRAQMYPGCAQIEVQSDVQGDLPGGVRVPEVLKHEMPGTTWSLDMYNSRKVDEDYVYPGGPLWDGERLVLDRPDLVPVPAE